ncbi:MAG: carboxypeptidase-like regulatory domain-containing protein [Rhodothermales bacterium]
MQTATLRVFLLLLLTAPAAWAQSGKISGQVTDAASGEALPGVNVVIDGTTRGAMTDGDGFYSILNVGPGQYALRFSFLGYATQIVEDVDVNIEETTTIDVALQDEALGLDEVVVRAERPVVQPDVSNSRLNVSAAELQSLPAPTIESIVTLQPGIQDGFVVRGSPASQLSFMVNGFLLRNERDNSPLTQTPVSAVEEIQVQTGGFNAEYGNVRSGVVNVVTKEGREDRYEATAILRYSPAAQKNFGPLANDLDSYWVRPYVDPEVAFVGTDAWDAATQAQYPRFEGWIAFAEGLLSDPDPTNDLTPEAAQQAFLYQHRKSLEITEPDYDVDIGLGGPVPGISQQLGGLRFYGSYRQTNDQYLIPLNTDSFVERTGHLKVTSNVASGMKLSVEGRLGNQEGTTASRSGGTGIFQSASGVADQLSPVTGSGVGFIDARIFATDYWNPTNVQYNQVGLTFTHAVNNSTFYQAKLNRLGFNYETFLGRARDTTDVVFFGGVGFDEAPFGFDPRTQAISIGDLRTSVGFSNGRDTSEVTTYNLQLDLTSQITPAFEVKTGLEYNITDQDIRYGRFDEFLPSANANFAWQRTPARGALYGQGKLTFKGMVANLGLRGEYFHAGGDFYDFSQFDPAFGGQAGNPIDGLDTLLTQEPTKRIVTLSPRLGVSFPVTAVSKLFVNYGHFRSLPQPTNVFLFGYETESGRISSVPNPNNPLPKTVAYELGYEQSFFEQFLVRVAGYYKDVTFEPQRVEYISRDGRARYFLSEPTGYADTRGFEFTVKRDRGRWVQGFFNYTYMVDSDGYFGFDTIDENTTEQTTRENDNAARRDAQNRPVPRPFARLNLDFFTPDDFGPRYSGFRPLAGWRVSMVGQWRDGGDVTWAGGGTRPGVLNNVDVKDPWRLDLRFARTFDLRGRELTFFADIFNLTNRRQFSAAGFVDGVDRDAYLASLHLPESDDYPNIVGDDNYGTVRPDDVAYVPTMRCEVRAEDCISLTTDMPANALYFEASTGTYLTYQDGAFAPADQSFVNRVLDDKAYIDMPNQNFLTFLGPRDVFFGIRLKL